MTTLLEKLKASGYHKKETKWPGTDNIIHLRVLNENDYLQASLSTDKLFSDTQIAIQNIDKYNAELETQYLFRAIEDPETCKQLFSNITDFRGLLTPEVKEILADELDSLHEEFSPDPMKMDQEEFDKLLNDVKKNAKETVGNVSNIFIARKLIIYLAKPLEK
jgi:hypothetical protein